MESQVEEIKNKLNVVDVVGSYIKLTKTGINYRGVCPFHSEKKPSFFVSPNRQMWHCFGCGAGHSIYDFVMKIEGVEFGDALRILAAKAGVELKRENPKLRTERQRLYEICDLACCFFEKQLEASVVGKEAKEYLEKRGINEDSIKKWRLGYSPDTWQSLSDFLVGKNYQRQEIIKAGLAVEKEDKTNSYDRFRGRIIFPIFDTNSQVIGFGARVFKIANEKETAKYINTPQTLLYNKSNVLYGMNNAKLAVRKSNQCVITEGYTDTIICHQAGFENTVASSGTALTLQHLNLLKRYTENLLLAFDMDLAGDTATKRGINLAEAQGFNIKIINAYSEKDPADIILENPKNWPDSIEKARSIMDYYFDSAFSAFDKAIPEGKKQIGRIILPAIKRIQNKIEQSHWIQKLSQKLDIREDAIIEELKNANPVRNSPPAAEIFNEVKSHPASRKKLIEDKI
ncbi:MAG: DNA primase, partial [Patescibacteria group bacterium]